MEKNSANEMQDNNQKPKNKPLINMSRKGRIWTIVLLVLVFVFGVSARLFRHYQGKKQADEFQKSIVPIHTEMPSKEEVYEAFGIQTHMSDTTDSVDVEALRRRLDSIKQELNKNSNN
jgi:hypothetical protein